MLLPAIGSAILFHLDASSGGTDIVAMIVRKYTSLNIGMALMVADALITLAALFCFGIQSGLFCILGLLMKSVLVDYVTDSFRMKKCFQIITTNPDPIIDFITVNLHRGATLEDVYGAFHHERKTMIITVLTRAQALALRRFVHANRPARFHGHHRLNGDRRQGLSRQLTVFSPEYTYKKVLLPAVWEEELF